MYLYKWPSEFIDIHMWTRELYLLQSYSLVNIHKQIRLCMLANDTP